MQKKKVRAEQENYVRLCCRCQRRVDAIETDNAMRYECGVIDCQKYTCYAFKPILPIAMNVLDSELPFRKKLRGAGMMLSPRETGTVLSEDKFLLRAKKTGYGIVLYWTPK